MMIHEVKIKDRRFSELRLFYFDVKRLNPAKYSHILPKARKERYDLLTTLESQKQNVGAYLLLKKALRKFHIDVSSYEFDYDSNGKPYIKDIPLKFSISHSKNIVMVLIGKEDLGVDIEYKKDINQEVRKLVFNEQDEAYFSSSKNKKDTFFEIWTLKEAYSKMLGKGLLENLKDINLENKNTKIKMLTFDFFKQFKVSIVTK